MTATLLCVSSAFGACPDRVGASLRYLFFLWRPQMRRRLIAGNWKMYKTLTDTRAFFSSFLPLVAASNHCDIVVAPPFTSISTAVDAVKGSSVAISGQDVDWHKEGAFTGQIAPAMLVEAGCRYVIIGHSDRRQ